MELKQGFKKLMCIALMGASLLLPVKSYAATGSIEAIASEKKDASYLRLMVGYGLPWKIEGCSALEMYSAGKGYSGRTTLSRSIDKTLVLMSEINHDKAPLSDAGIGVNINMPMPSNSYCTFKLMPLWIDHSGRYISDKIMAGYSIGADFGGGWSASSFGDMNLAAKEGTTWGYGEAKLTKQITNSLSVSYNPALRKVAPGVAMPTLEHRLNVEVKL